MSRRPRLAFACFVALAWVTASAAGRVADPPVSGLLVPVALLASATGGIGLFRRRLWPAALVLLPVGAYLVARLQIGLPPHATGAHLYLSFYAGRLADGAVVYAGQSFPLEAGSPDLRLLLALVAYVVVWAAAFIALSLRRPLAGVVVLLFLAGFGFTVDESRDVGLALAFIALAGGLLALSHPLPRERVRVKDAFAGGTTAIVAAVLALSVLGVTAVDAARPLQDWRAWRLIGPGNALLRFDWMQNYPRLLTRNGDAVVMEVHSPVASYWRANVLTVFTGDAWLSGSASKPLSPDKTGDGWSYVVPQPTSRGQQGRIVAQRFDVQSTYTDHLFSGGWSEEVRSDLPLDLAASDSGTVSVTPPRGPRTSYRVVAFIPDLGPTDLIGRGRSYPSEIAKEYLPLPFPAATSFTGTGAGQRWQAALTKPMASDWGGLYRLDSRVVGDETDPYRVALAIQSFLTGPQFKYSLRPPASDFSSPYAAFLFDTHTGYCQHFAGAMALLLRFNGIPARVVVGFTQGEEKHKGVFVVRRNDAHAWVEAYFANAGWKEFDPTPGRRLPDTSAGPGGSDAAGAVIAGALPGAAGRRSLDLPGRARVNDPGGPGVAGPATAPPPRWPWALVALAALAAWPVGRALLRRRGLHSTSSDERLQAAVRLLYATLRDHGVAVPAAQTLDETAGLLRDRYGVDAGDVPARVQAVAFGGRDADDEDVAAVRALRRRVAARLRSHDGIVARIGALYGLRKTRPLSPAGERGAHLMSA